MSFEGGHVAWDMTSGTETSLAMLGRVCLFFQNVQLRSDIKSFCIVHNFEDHEFLAAIRIIAFEVAGVVVVCLKT